MINKVGLTQYNVIDEFDKVCKEHHLSKENDFLGLSVSLLYQVIPQTNLHWSIDILDKDYEDLANEYLKPLNQTLQFKLVGIYLSWVEGMFNQRVLFVNYFNLEQVVKEIQKYCKKNHLDLHSRFRFEDYSDKF